jgi:hypothetical protein
VYEGPRGGTVRGAAPWRTFVSTLAWIGGTVSIVHRRRILHLGTIALDVPLGSGDALALIAFAPSKVDRETRILYREDSVRSNRKMRT